MTKTLCCAALAAAFAFGGPALSQPRAELTVVSESAYAPSGVRRLVLHSARLGRDFVVVVAPPGTLPGQSWTAQRPAASKLAAIYALDGGYGVAGPLAQMLAGTGAMSPAYVVSVSYPETGPNMRNTDLLHRTVSEGGASYGGGGAAFQAFLTDELRPFLEARYPLDPAKAILVGHSFGGLFAANVLAEAPESFSGYVIASASTWRDPQLTARLAAAAHRGGGRRVLVAVGGKEEARMAAGADEIAQALAAAGSTFEVEKRVFAGEGHLSYYPQLAQAAFAWMLPSAAAGRTVIAVAPEALERLVGVYAYADGRLVTITRREDTLFAQVTGTPGQTELLAETPQRFFAPGGFDVLITFEGQADSPPRELVVRINGAEERAVRRR